LGLGRNVLTAALIIAGVGTGALAIPQDEAIPTFGTTVVVPGGLLGVIYAISPFSKFLPYFQSLDPLGAIYTSTLNVTPRNFLQGFPGVTDRYEWFAIDYSGRFWIEKPGLYRFELTSDDGSKLYIDDQSVVDNEGIHPPETRTGELTLAGGIHRIRVSYFQGPRDAVALVLRVAGPGEEWHVFSTEEFKPPSDPTTWMYLGQALHISPVSGAPGEKIKLEISLDSAASRAPTTLKWDVVFPVQLLELEGNEPEIGAAAMDSGKSLTCTAQKPYSYACSLSGGKNPVANGPIAIFHFKIRATAPTGTAAVRIEKAEAVTLDYKELTLDNADGTVTIRRR
jgi:PA14 domain